MGAGRFRAAVAAGGATVLVAVSACGGGHRAAPGPTAGSTTTVPSATAAEVTTAFVSAWQRRAWGAMAATLDSVPDDFAGTLGGIYAGLGATDLSVRATAPVVTGTTASANVTQHLTVTGGHPLSLATTLDLVRRQGRWRVAWTLATVESDLAAGDRLILRRVVPPRAAIVGAGGRPLVRTEDLVEVGVVGQRIRRPGAVRALLVAGGASPAAASAALAAARAAPGQFVPVYDITAAAFAARVRHSALYRIAGTTFEPTTRTVAVSPGLADGVVGTLGPVTAQQLAELGAPYEAGDTVGQTGLEAIDERTLAGTPGVDVVVVDPTGAVTATVADFPATPGTVVTTSIALSLQRAAEAAIAGTAVPSALVAVRASTGQVLAVATHDPTGSGVDWALDATEAPGSTFKTVTSTALIADAGLTLTAPATCPASRTVDGETFHNDDGEASGSTDLLDAFAQSCNTAFIGLATADLTPARLAAAARLYRLGTTPQMGYPAYGGSVPVPTDAADLAATAIGQGRTTVSPLDMAMVAAAVDAGAVHAPRLVTGAPDDAVAAAPLPAAVVSDLRTMMAAVVTSGTAAGSGLPAGTAGKTGTAEYGDAVPPLTHAWFIGYRGDIAFACFVETGVSGAAVAAPLVARFLDTPAVTAAASATAAAPGPTSSSTSTSTTSTSTSSATTTAVAGG